MKIGILSKNYAAKRLFLDKIEGANYKDIRYNNYYLWRNAHLWFLRMIGKLRMSPEEQAAKLFYDYKNLLPTNCDIFHFFNTINHSTKQPWVISIESGVPWPLNVTRCVESVDGDLTPIKNDKYIERALSRLATPNCLGLLALSDCTKRIQIEILRQYPQYTDAITKKLITLHPPQNLFIQDITEKGLTYADDELFTFFYVGRNFYRKGGRETVEVLSELHKSYDFRLILISGMDTDEARFMRTSDDEKDAMNLIQANRGWIEFYHGLPNDKVMELAKRSHVALLPTWMDTYGYSILETMACGTPTIATSLRALTEINDASVGWLLNVPVNRLNNPIHNTKEQQDIFYKTLKKELKEKIVYVLKHRQEVKEKAKCGLGKIRVRHNPIEYTRKIELIYKGGIAELL